MDWNLFLVLTIPFLLLLANNEWLFPAGNPTDNWHNVVYFHQDGRDLPALYESYRATRLSWIMKGFLAHKFFPPLVAHYVLHLTMFLLILLVFYLIVRDLFNEHIAVFSAIAFGTHSQFHSVTSFEWDYQNHDAILNFLLTLLFFLFAARKRAWKMWLALAGAAWVAALQSTYPGTYVLVLPFWYLWLNHRSNRNPILPSIGYFLIGGIAAVFFFCVVSALLGGPFFYFMTPIDLILHFGFGSVRFHIGYWQPLEYVLRHTKGLALPLAISIASVLVLTAIFLRRRNGKTVDGVVLVLSSLLIGAFMHGLSQSVGHGHMNNDNMSNSGLSLVFLGVAGIYAYILRMSGLTVPANAPAAASLKIIVLALFVGSLYFSVGISELIARIISYIYAFVGLSNKYEHWPSIEALKFLTLFSVGGGALALVMGRHRIARIYIPAIAFSAFLALVNLKTSSIPIAAYDWNNRCAYRADQYQAIYDTYLRVKAFDPTFTLRLWYKNNETAPHQDPRCTSSDFGRYYGRMSISLTELYGGLAGFTFFLTSPSAGLVDDYLASASFENLPSRRVDELPKAFRGAILAKDKQDHATALNTLRSRGMKVLVLDRFFVRRGTIAFDVTVIDARKDDRARAGTRL